MPAQPSLNELWLFDSQATTLPESGLWYYDSGLPLLLLPSPRTHIRRLLCTKVVTQSPLISLSKHAFLSARHSVDLSVAATTSAFAFQCILQTAS